MGETAGRRRYLWRAFGPLAAFAFGVAFIVAGVGYPIEGGALDAVGLSSFWAIFGGAALLFGLTIYLSRTELLEAFLNGASEPPLIYFVFPVCLLLSPLLVAWALVANLVRYFAAE